MPPPVACPGCAEDLDVPARLRGGPVRCAACQAVFTPAGDRPRVARPAKRSRGPARAAWVVLGVVGLLGAGCCGVFGLFTVRMMSPKFEPYTSPDGTFAARFPGKVTEGKRATGRGDEQAASAESRRGVFQETYYVYHLPLSAADRRKPPSEVADTLCDGLRNQTGGTELQRTRRAHQGHPAADVAVQQKGGLFTVARAVVADGHAYVIGLTGPGEPDGKFWADEFLDGLDVRPPPAAPAKDEPPAKRDDNPNPFVRRKRKGDGK